MPFGAYFPQIKLLHLALVMASGTLFAMRGAVLLAGQSWAMARPLRRASMLIDTLLLAAGVTLWVQLGLNPVHDRWLAVKLVAVLAYIGLGTLALRHARTPRMRLACYVAALLMFGFIASVARTHQPLGLFHRTGSLAAAAA